MPAHNAKRSMRAVEGQRPSILVVGDLMLDRYAWGTVARVSPEAPVPVLSLGSREARPGGAASAAALLAGLEVNVRLSGVVGDDNDGRLLLRLLSEAGVRHEGVLEDALRPTTVKERIVARANGGSPHQIVRVDHESCRAIDDGLEGRLIAHIRNGIRECRAILISDYGKGCCTANLLRCTIQAATASGPLVLVDPARGADWAQYEGCTLLKCNRPEAEWFCRCYLDDQPALRKAVDHIRRLTAARHVVITLDGEGMYCDGRLYPTRRRQAVDVTGAGDMGLAALGLGLASGSSIEEAVQLANSAAGLEVERVGCAPVRREELLGALLGEAGQGIQKIVTRKDLQRLVEDYRGQGKRIVFTNGCFAALHAGHIAYLREAKTLGDILIVAINSSDSIRRLKGQRPVIADLDRLTLLASLEFIDHVLVFDDDTPHALLQSIKPDMLVKGGTTSYVVGHEVVESYGGQVRILPAVSGISTSDIVSSTLRNQCVCL